MKDRVLLLLCAVALAQGVDLDLKKQQCNCNPSEAQQICEANYGADNIFIAHENCNQFYQCANGRPVAIACQGNLLYDPYLEVCNWPDQVDCGDRPIADSTDPDCDGNPPGGDDGGNDNDGTCNCDPSEAPAICAAENSEGVFVAHENCNQFYVCSGGKPQALVCPAGLLYNPYVRDCDWPDNVECKDRVIPEPDDNPVTDNNNDGDDNDNDGTCNCNPEEAPSICAAPDSEGVLIAHENCNQYYICNFGKPIGFPCPGQLLYNPYSQQCDYPVNVDCGDRIVPEPENNCPSCNGDDDSDDIDDRPPQGDDGGNDIDDRPPQGDDGGNDIVDRPPQGDDGGNDIDDRPPQGDDGGNDIDDRPPQGDDGGNDIDDRPPQGDDGNDNGGNDGDDVVGGGNCDPSEAPAICAAEDSDDVLVAHENCNQYYICDGGKPIARPCPDNLFFNPNTDRCDWPENVDCGDRVIPEPDEDDNGGSDNGGSDNGGSDNGGNDNGGSDNGGSDNGGNDNGGSDNGGSDNDGSDNGDNDNGGSDNDGDDVVGGGNCDPSEAPAICAAEDSDDVLVAHENCNKYYICDGGKPIARPCPGNLFFNPNTDRCDWPENVDCGDRVIPEPDDDDNGGSDNGGIDNGGSDNGGSDNGGSDNGGSDNGGSDNGGSDNGDNDNGGSDNDGDDVVGGGNCDPSEAPAICAAEDSDDVLVAHENCNKYYICDGGKPIARPCPGNLFFNPNTDRCDWPENVDCGDRVIPEPDDDDNGGSDNGGSDNGGSDNGGSDNGGSDNGGSDNGGSDNGGSDNGGSDNGGSDNDGDDVVGGGNCDPSEAPAICAAEDSDDVLVAHENCNQYYICDGGKPIARPCPGNLFFNPNTDRCDWPENVDCGDRYVPDSDDSDDSSDSDDIDNLPPVGDDPGSDNDDLPPVGDDSGSDSDDSDCDNDNNDNDVPCNCRPEDAPSICSVGGSDGEYIAHEHCNKYYQCSNGKPVAIRCPPGLLYNPYTVTCDWPYNVDCGDRVIPDSDEDSSASESDEVDGGNDNDGTCNCNPEEAPAICAADGSSGVLIAHENCNQFYQCANGVPVALKCPANTLYNPYKEICDWADNVECGNRVIPDPDDDDNDSGSDNDNSGPDNNQPINDDPSQAPAICADSGADGVLVAHENCNQYYICSAGEPLAMLCSNGLLFNPINGACDWPQNVNCGDRVIPEDDCACDPRNAKKLCSGPASNGMLVAHEDCSQFYMCNSGVPIAMVCPENLLFNADKLLCDWPQNVNCNSRMSFAALNKHLESRQSLRK
ncbi:unnamed protein product [Chrysodeixis includens]|uniref:Chitin-binding type-2 domain-containing protein n=1 Tax=Chrysodeixis includens TaxID=689277 RepID=A0A9P0BSA2_CHRIL|nr:unnamed protein product [Chrysodeixis includens]